MSRLREESFCWGNGGGTSPFLQAKSEFASVSVNPAIGAQVDKTIHFDTKTVERRQMQDEIVVKIRNERNDKANQRFLGHV